MRGGTRRAGKAMASCGASSEPVRCVGERGRDNSECRRSCRQDLRANVEGRGFEGRYCASAGDEDEDVEMHIGCGEEEGCVSSGDRRISAWPSERQSGGSSRRKAESEGLPKASAGRWNKGEAKPPAEEQGEDRRSARAARAWRTRAEEDAGC